MIMISSTRTSAALAPRGVSPARRALLLGATACIFAMAPARAAETRIVSLGGAVTEILYALGKGDAIVAVDTTSVFPPEAMREKQQVGYLRQLSAEGILSTHPSQVIAAEGAGPPDVLTLISEAGVPILKLPEPPTAEGVTDKIAEIGKAAGVVEAAGMLANKVKEGFEALAAERAKIGKPVRTLFVLSLQNGRAMVGGKGSSADSILSLAGAENAATDITGFKPITDEALIAAAPEAIVMMTNGPAPPTAESVFAHPALSQVPAAATRRLITMDGLYLLGFGPRAPLAARELMGRLYPDRAQ